MLAYKIPDEGLGAKPFDLFVLRGVPAFVCAVFEKRFYLMVIAAAEALFAESPCASEREVAAVAEQSGTV